jgi:hypothetical protein
LWTLPADPAGCVVCYFVSSGQIIKHTTAKLRMASSLVVRAGSRNRATCALRGVNGQDVGVTGGQVPRGKVLIRGRGLWDARSYACVASTRLCSALLLLFVLLPPPSCVSLPHQVLLVPSFPFFFFRPPSCSYNGGHDRTLLTCRWLAWPAG